MKYLVSLALILFSAVSFASGPALYDLMYLPKSGTLFGSTDSIFSWGKSTLHHETNGDLGTQNTISYGLIQSVGYSFTDRLFVSASLNYLKNDSDIDFKTTSDEELTTKGLSDPSFGARFRAIDSEYLLDFLLFADLSLEDAKVATNSKDGNNKYGGHVAGAAVDFGKKKADLQYSFNFGVRHFFEATQELNSLEIEVNPHTAYNLKSSILFTINERSFLNTFAQITFTNSYNDDSGSKISQSSRIDLGADYRYLISQNLMVKGGLMYTNFENNVVDSIETREDIFLSAVAGASYQF
jgi:hypothetical protein